MWPYPQETADLITFTEEIIDGKLHSLGSANSEWCLEISMHEKKYSCCQLFDTVYKNYLCAEILVWRYSPKISQFS